MSTVKVKRSMKQKNAGVSIPMPSKLSERVNKLCSDKLANDGSYKKFYYHHQAGNEFEDKLVKYLFNITAKTFKLSTKGVSVEINGGIYNRKSFTRITAPSDKVLIRLIYNFNHPETYHLNPVSEPSDPIKSVMFTNQQVSVPVPADHILICPSGSIAQQEVNIDNRTLVKFPNTEFWKSIGGQQSTIRSRNYRRIVAVVDYYSDDSDDIERVKSIFTTTSSFVSIIESLTSKEKSKDELNEEINRLLEED